MIVRLLRNYEDGVISIRDLEQRQIAVVPANHVLAARMKNRASIYVEAEWSGGVLEIGEESKR